MGIEKRGYKEKYRDRWHLLKHPGPIRIMIHKLEDDEDYEFYYFDEIESEVDRMVDMLSDRFECIVDTREIDKNESILYTDIILIPKF